MSTLRDVATVSNSDCIVVRFSTEDYAPHERIEALHEVFGRSLQKVQVEPAEPESFQTAVTLRRMPGLSQMTGYRSAAIYRRSRELIEHDDVILVGGFTSDYEAHHRGRTLNMGPGEAVILTGAEPSSFGGLAQNSVQLLRVPMRLLSPLAADLESAYGRIIPSENRALQLLTAYLAILEKMDAVSAHGFEPQVVTHIHDLMALVIGATRDAAEIATLGGARAARLSAIKQDIANCLDQPDLSITMIAVRHRLEPRWVQRLFEREGETFTEYVLAQRLVCAHRMLRSPLYGNQKVSTIALNSGFGDLSYFNRTFRRRYGMAPSELRAAAMSAV